MILKHIGFWFNVSDVLKLQVRLIKLKNAALLSVVEEKFIKKIVLLLIQAFVAF